MADDEREARTITKADLVEAVHESVGFSKKESSEVVERVFESMKATLSAGEGLKISGFGKFDIRRKNARRGRNPKTEDGLIIPERTVVTFKASAVLKSVVAGPDAVSVTTTTTPQPAGPAAVAGFGTPSSSDEA